MSTALEKDGYRARTLIREIVLERAVPQYARADVARGAEPAAEEARAAALSCYEDDRLTTSITRDERFCVAPGAAVALPWLEVMAKELKSSPSRRLRMAFMFMPNGVRPDYWTPAGDGETAMRSRRT